MEKSDLPIIVESDTSNLSGHPQSSKRSSSRGGDLIRLIPKLLFLVLGIIIIAEVIIGIRVLTTPPPSVGKIQPITGGNIALVTTQKDYKSGERVPVTVKIDTGGHTVNGIDVVIKYDPAVLELKRDGIQTNGVFEEYPLIFVDEKEGRAQISGISSLAQQGFNGIGNVATVTFTARSAPATTIVSIDYKPGLTTESNMTEAGTAQDLLESVNDIQLSLKN